MLFRRYELLKTLFLFRCRQFSLKEPKPFGYVATKADPNFLRNLKSSLEAYGDDQDSSVKSRTIKRPSSSKSIQEQAYFFAQEIKKLINSGRIQSALELFEEIKIKYRYIFHPTNSYDVRQSATTIFTTLMSGLARDGNVDKVLELHRDVKSHNLILNAVVYVTLFNAFANSSAIHTDRIMQIIHEIKTRKIFVNTRVALSLMKALVHSGAVEPLFDGEIFRMLNWKLYPLLKNDPMFYRYLLMGCTNDKERGTARMFNVLREMHSLEIPVDRSHVHSVLLCLRECGIGSDRSFAVQTIVDSKLIEEPKSQSLTSMIVKDSDNELDIIEEESHPQTLLSVLDKNVTTSGLVHALYAISKNPQDKLQCIGGVEGAIHAILHNGEQPDIRTFDLLLQVGGLRVFEDILSSMKTHNVTPDADFFNRAIFQASITKNHDSIPTILDNFRDFDLSPNKKSICTLARSCTNVQNAQEIISKIHYFPDVSLENVLMEILEAGLGRRSPQLLKFFFREILEHKIKIEKEVILKLEDFFSDANFKELFRQNLLNKEKYQRNYDHLNSVKLLNYVEFLQKVVVK